MSVRRQVEKTVFNGKRVFRPGRAKVFYLASGTYSGGTNWRDVGAIVYSSATGDCFVTINTAGTGTQINA